MSPESEEAMAVLRRMAKGHAGASSGERAAWDILGNFREGARVDFVDAFVRLDGRGKRAVLQVLVDVAGGKTGTADLR